MCNVAFVEATGDALRVIVLREHEIKFDFSNVYYGTWLDMRDGCLIHTDDARMRGEAISSCAVLMCWYRCVGVRVQQVVVLVE